MSSRTVFHRTLGIRIAQLSLARYTTCCIEPYLSRRITIHSPTAGIRFPLLPLDAQSSVLRPVLPDIPLPHSQNDTSYLQHLLNPRPASAQNPNQEHVRPRLNPLPPQPLHPYPPSSVSPCGTSYSSDVYTFLPPSPTTPRFSILPFLNSRG